jgi:hypothetical protein
MQFSSEPLYIGLPQSGEKPVRSKHQITATKTSAKQHALSSYKYPEGPFRRAYKDHYKTS